MSHDPIHDLARSSPDVMQDLRSLVDSTVVAEIRWYQEHASLPRLAHRLSGISIVALSVSLPLVAFQEFRGKNFVISIMGVLIAFLSGLNSFFNWGEIWKAHIRAMVDLKNHLSVWELRMLEAKYDNDPQGRSRTAVEATTALLDVLKSAGNRNTEEYFQQLNFPDKKT